MPQEHPLICRTEVVRNILSGRQTQDRRPVRLPAWLRRLRAELYNSRTFKDPGFGDCEYLHVFCPVIWGSDGMLVHDATVQRLYPPWIVGDVLWVRETHYVYHVNTWNLPKTINPNDPREACYYRASWDRVAPRWQPSIHMPRWAARIFLRVKAVRAERLRDISMDDVRAEGFAAPANKAPFWMDFVEAWDAMYAKRGYGWQLTPWVWVTEFERVQAAVSATP